MTQEEWDELKPGDLVKANAWTEDNYWVVLGPHKTYEHSFLLACCWMTDNSVSLPRVQAATDRTYWDKCT